MSNPFGAIDLFAGQKAISGTDLFGLDKNPLNVLSLGQGLLDDAIIAIERSIDEAIHNIPKYIEAVLYFLGELTEDFVNEILGFFGLPQLPPGASIAFVGELIHLPYVILNDLLVFLGIGPVSTVEAGLILGQVIKRPALFLEFLLDGLGLKPEIDDAHELIAFLKGLGGGVIGGLVAFAEAVLGGVDLAVELTAEAGTELANLLNTFIPIATLNNAIGETIAFVVGTWDSFVSGVVGAIENTFPFIAPFVMGAETTIKDMTSFLNHLASVRDLQQLQDLIYNALRGLPGVNWVFGTSKADLAAVLTGFQETASAAESMAQRALMTVENFLSAEVQQLFTIPGSTISADLGTLALEAGGLSSQLQLLIDAGVQGFNGIEQIGNSIPQFFAAASGIAGLLGWSPTSAPPPTSIAALTQAHENFIARMSAYTANYTALLDGADVTFSLQPYLGNGSAPTVAVTASQSLIGYINTLHGGDKKSVGWLGGRTLNIDSIVVNIYSVNIDDGSLHLIYTSGNMLTTSQTPGDNLTPEWTYWNFTEAPFNFPPIAASQGNIYAVEIQTIGSGTYNVVGIGSSWLPAHPTAIPATYSAQRIGAAPVFDAIGAVPGILQATSSTTFSGSWLHYFGESANTGAIIWVEILGNGASISSGTITIGGISVSTTPIVSEFIDNTSTIGYIAGFVATGIPSGYQTININLTLSAAGYGSAVSISYLNVGTPVSGGAIFGTTGLATQTVSAATGETVVQAFADYLATTDISGYTQNRRIDFNGNSYGSTSLYEHGLTVGDAPGAASVNFSAYNPGYYGGAAVILPSVVAAAPAWLPAPSGASSIPYFEFAGAGGQTQYAPDQYTFTSSGIFIPPTWADFFDIIICSDGGAGLGGSYSSATQPGGPGFWYATTVTAAQMGLNPVHISIGTGGAYNSGNGGQGCTVALPGGGTFTAPGTYPGHGAIFVPGGAGSPGGYPGQIGIAGSSPGNITYAGGQGGPTITWPGGAGGGSPQASGSQPGGAGAGANAAFIGRYIYGGAGGAGVVYIVAYT